MSKLFGSLAASLVLLVAASVQAETTVTITGVHLCCGGCIVGVNDAVDEFKDTAKVEPNQKSKSITITAKDDATAQKVINAIADAGYFGKLDNDKLKMPTAEVPSGNVKRIELVTHNCCGACTKAIKGAIGKVAGVQADTTTSKKDDFVVEGDFIATDLVKSLADAGFNVQVKK